MTGNYVHDLLRTLGPISAYRYVYYFFSIYIVRSLNKIPIFLLRYIRHRAVAELLFPPSVLSELLSESSRNEGNFFVNFSVSVVSKYVYIKRATYLVLLIN